VRYSLLVLGSALGLVSCGTTTATSGEALAAFCDDVYLCYAFSDSLQCQDNWFDPANEGAACEDELKYLDCVSPCAADGCGPDLDDCEFDCFNKHCGDVVR
jgi:hypothetical protein